MPSLFKIGKIIGESEFSKVALVRKIIKTEE